MLYHFKRLRDRVRTAEARFTRASLALGLLPLAFVLAGCSSTPYVDGPTRLGAFASAGDDDARAGASVRGTLSAKDGTRSGDMYVDSYSFQGRAGEVVQLELMSEDFDCYLFLYDGAGQLMAEDDDSGGSYDSRLTATLPSDGIYLVVASSYYAREEGTYRLRVERVDARARYPSLALPAAIDRRFDGHTPRGDGNRPFHVYAVDLEAGLNVVVEMTSNQLDTYLYLVDDKGDEVASDDDSAGNLDARIDIAPPRSGRYFVVATTFGDMFTVRPMPYHLRIQQY